MGSNRSSKNPSFSLEKVSKKSKEEKKKADDEKEDMKKKEAKKENCVEDRSMPENKMGQEIEEIFRANKRKRKSSTIAKMASGNEDEFKKKKNKKKKIGFAVDESCENLVKRRRTNDGFAIYSEKELGILNPDAGNTPLCPFDCSCCF